MVEPVFAFVVTDNELPITARKGPAIKPDRLDDTRVSTAFASGCGPGATAQEHGRPADRKPSDPLKRDPAAKDLSHDEHRPRTAQRANHRPADRRVLAG